ncbi:hypothetical protein CASFOL_035052 [Castilleja foliolosa]|uniref:Uncharacterized protein n=1 Tax=Castilleja foliolosa TaxID=1961234 RepID=A0ABD3BTW6_9LAMI
MSKHNKYAKTEEKDEENSAIINSEIEYIGDDDDGYHTPTSEEYKIPAVVLSCPPPPPRKRRRLVLMRASDLQKRLDQVVENTIIIKEEDLDFLFRSIAGESRVPASPGSTKICVDEE